MDDNVAKLLWPPILTPFINSVTLLGAAVLRGELLTVFWSWLTFLAECLAVISRLYKHVIDFTIIRGIEEISK